MGRVRHIEVSGPADPAVVWERYARLSLWPTWSPQIRSVEAGSERLAPGLVGVVHGLLGVTVHFEVLEVDETARTWSWVARSGPVTMRLHHAVLAAGSGTRTTLDIDGPGPLPILYAPVAEVALRRLVRP